MAIFRWFYRRKRVVLILSLVSLFWAAYLYLSIPSPTGKREERPTKEISLPRSHFLQPTKKLNKLKKIIFKNHSMINVINFTKNGTVKKRGHLDKVFQIGETLKNKTFEIGAKMKNKTLEKLSAMGVIKHRRVIKFISESFRLDLNITMIDLANFMMDTHNLNKVLLPTERVGKKQNYTVEKTVNTTQQLKKQVNGGCDCYHVQCICCAQIHIMKLHLNNKACANFTLLPKFQEFDFKFVFNNKLVYNQTIQAENPPMICLGSKSKAAELCMKFMNMTFQVTAHEAHKTLLSGCAKFNLNLFNRTIGMYPLGCFQIPDVHKHKNGHANPMGNWVP